MHAYLAAALMLMPFQRQARADEPEWYYDHSEAQVTVTLAATGTAAPGGTTTLQAEVRYLTWDVWTTSEGGSDIRNSANVPATYTSVSWAVESGDGSVASSETSTDGYGFATVGFTMGQGTSVVRAQSNYGAANGASVTLELAPETPPPEEMWSYSHSATSYSIGLTGPGPVAPGEVGEVTAAVHYESWEVWTSNLGNTTTVPIGSGPAVGSVVQWSVSSGDGSLSESSSTADSSGLATVSLTMGQTETTVNGQMDAGSEWIGSSVVVPVGEGWSYDHDESMMRIELSHNGPVAVGGSVDVQALIQRETWEVWVSNLGGSQTRNLVTVPAAGAQVQWWKESGSGGVNGSTSSTADSEGRAATGFTMGYGASVVGVQATQDGVQAATANLTLEPLPESWSLSSSQTNLTGVSLNADGDLSGLVPGTQRTVTAVVTATTTEYWTSDWGNSTTSTQTVAALGVPVAFVIQSGGGTLEVVSGTTDSFGQASAIFTMGGSDSVVVVVAGDSGMGEVAETVSFMVAPEEWGFDHTEEGYALDLSTGGSTQDVPASETRQVTGHVTFSTWEVWTSNYGNTGTVITSTSDVADVEVEFAVASGDGVVAAASAMTDAGGLAEVTFTMGAADSVVAATLGDPANGGLTASISFLAPVEWWQYDHSEATIWTTVTADGPATEVPAGAQRTVTARVEGNFWEVWVSNLGNYRTQNESNGPAQGAPVTFSLPVSGGGSLDANLISGYTDENGYYSTVFTMGTEAAYVQADASFLTATSMGSMDFSPEPWVFDHLVEEVDVVVTAGSSEAGTMNVGVTAAVSYETWEVWTKSSGATEDRNFSSGPAVGAQVSFSASGGTISGDASSTDGNGMVTGMFNASNYGTCTVTVGATFGNGTGEGTVNITIMEPPPQCAGCSSSSCPGAWCGCGGSGECGGGGGGTGGGTGGGGTEGGGGGSGGGGNNDPPPPPPPFSCPCAGDICSPFRCTEQSNCDNDFTMCTHTVCPGHCPNQNCACTDRYCSAGECGACGCDVDGCDCGTDKRCPSGAQTCSDAQAEVKINGTEDDLDDIVRRQQIVGTTAWRQWVSCSVKVQGAASKGITSIGATAGGALRFYAGTSAPGNTTVGSASLAVPLQGENCTFWMSGVTESGSVGDVALKIRKNGTGGDELAEKAVTVFWFESIVKAQVGQGSSAAMSLSAGSSSFGMQGGGMDVGGSASVIPSGLDHSVPQIANWRFGVVQNVTTTRTWRGKYTQGGVEKKVRGVMTMTKTLDTFHAAPEFLLQINNISGSQMFDPARSASSGIRDAPSMPANVSGFITYGSNAVNWVESIMSDSFTIWSGIVEVTNGQIGAVFVPIKQNSWQASGTSSQANQSATPSTGDGGSPSTVPNLQHPSAIEKANLPTLQAYSWTVDP